MSRPRKWMYTNHSPAAPLELREMFGCYNKMEPGGSCRDCASPDNGPGEYVCRCLTDAEVAMERLRGRITDDYNA